MDTISTGTHGVLTLSCPDTVGIVHAVSGFILEHGGTIVEAQQFNDPDTGTFFMRVRFGAAAGGPLALAHLAAAFGTIAARYEMTWRLLDAAQRRRVLIMVSREGHCLNDLLYRNSVGELNLEVVAVVSNHEDLRWIADSHTIPFHHLPITPETRTEAEAALLGLIDAESVELVVLARYMQILSPHLCARLSGQVINIHHSMLPSFKGARPYHQAHARGVKLIGATAHYVTAELDEGPIIEQEIERVDHAMSAEEFAARGREVEARALARAVRHHTENRVVLNGVRTVVLR
ncbi:formyltetrahydrofolate deformylase [Conexibacter sp. DBS9H8]|uniref:formyltetrahydrofolate deformylase n=1 Tax=Conexibacter sp. DBS9H8 TaxID=2937801 RepID=UPI00200DA269|nr:formyltetrahydrofolate deformylase [Conexibacter sp. DBS9H8]